jgi:hypothetical protein
LRWHRHAGLGLGEHGPNERLNWTIEDEVQGAITQHGGVRRLFVGMALVWRRDTKCPYLARQRSGFDTADK